MKDENELIKLRKEELSRDYEDWDDMAKAIKSHSGPTREHWIDLDEFLKKHSKGFGRIGKRYRGKYASTK